MFTFRHQRALKQLSIVDIAPSVRRIVRLSGACLLLSLGASTQLLMAGGSPQTINATPLVVERSWRSEDGLPTHNIHALVETADHVLWIGEQHGLFKFDGSVFSRFLLSDRLNGVLSDIGVNCLLALDDGQLLVGTEGEGVLIIHERKARRIIATPGQTFPQVVRTLFRDHYGKVWIGADQGLFLLNGDHIAEIQLPSFFVRTIMEDASGDIWVGGSKLIRISQDRISDIPLADIRNQPIVTALSLDRFGDIWVGTFDGLFLLKGQQLEATEIKAPVTVLLTENTGASFAATGFGRIYQLRSRQEWTTKSLLENVTNAAALSSDGNGNLWAGTDRSLVRLTRTRIQRYDLPTSNILRGISLTLGSGDLLMADGHLYRYSSHRFEQLELKDLGAKVSTAIRARDGSLWVGTDGAGLYHLDRSRNVHLSLKNGMPNDHIKTILQSHDGAIWAGTDGGVARIDAKGVRRFQVPNGLAYFSVTALLEDGQGDIWVGTSRGLSHLHNNGFVVGPAIQRLSSEVVLSMMNTAGGGLLVGTDSGLFYVSHSSVRHIPLSDTFTSATVANLLSDKHGMIWLTSFSGVACFKQSDLTQTAQPGTQPSPVAFLSSEEIGYRSVATGPPPASVLTMSGHLVLGTTDGILIIDAQSLHVASPPPIAIRTISVNNKPLVVDSPDAAWLNRNAQNIEIEYSASSIGAQDRLRYQYKMEGVDRDWSQPDARRIAYYTTLSPGFHKFRVRVREIGASGDTETELLIYQAPRFHQTWTFRILVIFATGFVIASIMWLRSRQIRLRYAAVLQERTRMAREMHDTLIQGCTSSSAFLEAYELASTKFGGNVKAGPAAGYLDRAREQLAATISEARAAMWNLRTQGSTLSSLAHSIEDNIDRMKRDEVDVSFVHDNQELSLSREQVFELGMIAREALNNALTHSGASRITIDMSSTEEHLLLTVSDNGRGFDHSIVKMCVSGHYGILGMKERASRLSGAMRLEGAVGIGTTVHVIIPIDREEDR